LKEQTALTESLGRAGQRPQAARLLDETLVIWAAIPAARRWCREVTTARSSPNAFTMWLARRRNQARGITLGETDEFGFNAVTDKVHVHDLHATILQLARLRPHPATYRFKAATFRLTDVAGDVVTRCGLISERASLLSAYRAARQAVACSP